MNESCIYFDNFGIFGILLKIEAWPILLHELINYSDTIGREEVHVMFTWTS